MSRPWEAEHAVSMDEARRLIESQFPELAPARIEPLGIGWDNTALLVNETLVFRFPRRELAVRFIEIETHVLPTIASRLPLPVPVPTHVGRPADGFPWPFAGYELLPGTCACSVDLTTEQRRAAAVPLARFLASLHAISAEEAAGFGAPPDRFRRIEIPLRREKAQSNLVTLKQIGIISDDAPLIAILNQTDNNRPPRETSLVHGDLYARHLLVDADALPCGVIDWGDVHVGDPALDISLAHGLLPREAHAQFREAYGEIDEDTWNAARFRALSHATVTTLYGHEMDDLPLLREGLTVLRNVAG